MKKTIKIIDLLNTEKDNLPKKIKIDDTIYNLFIDEDNLIYYQNEDCKYFMFSVSCFNELNDEVEILDEEEFEDIEELDDKYCYPNDILQNKINQLIKNQKILIERIKNENEKIK